MARLSSYSHFPLSWQSAAAFAAAAHEHEFRDDQRTPYFSHPARVAMTVSVLFACPDEAAITAAFLHDVLENTDEGYDDLKKHFGRTVSDLVVALTKNMMLPSSQRERDYERRLAKADWRARLVKLADEFDNYCDVLKGEKHDTKKEMKQKCRRAMALAERDSRAHPETRTAIKALKRLLKGQAPGKGGKSM